MPPGTRAMLVSVAASTPDGLVGVSRVADPADTVRYLADLRAQQVLVDDLDHRVLADKAALGVYVGAPLGGELAEGTWRLRVAATAGPAIVRSALTSGPVDATHRLDLAVWVTADLASHGLGPDQLADRWRADMTPVLAPHGIEIGTLAVVLAGEDAAGHRAVGVEGLADDAHQACEAAADAVAAGGASERTAVVVLADRVSEDLLPAWRGPDGEVHGFAVSTPGTPVLGPSSHACAVVAAGADPAGAGLTVLHEVLHLAGLVAHTTSREGTRFDAFADTPECAAATADANGDGVVVATECVGAGADNLMFWEAGGTRLSAEQAWSIRWHPLMQTQVN